MNIGLTFDDVLLQPKRGVLHSRADADIYCYDFGLEIPIFSAPMPSVASVSLLKEIIRLGGAGVVNRMEVSPVDQVHVWEDVGKHPNCFVAIGLEPESFTYCVSNGVRNFVLDVAHAHTDRVLNFVKWVVEDYSYVNMIVGNVATSDAAFDFSNTGIAGLKVGVGPGSVCTTRKVTGFGVPQISAIQQCAGYGSWNPVIADGGIRSSGDIVKAFAAGASAVMIGSLFANSIEAGNDGIHYGNASKRVNGHHAPEGIEMDLGEPEPLEDIVKRLMWGLKSAISYGGARNIKELQDKHEFIVLTDAGREESKLNA